MVKFLTLVLYPGLVLTEVTMGYFTREGPPGWGALLLPMLREYGMAFWR